MNVTDDILHSIDKRLSNLEACLSERCKIQNNRIEKLEDRVDNIRNPAYVVGGLVAVLQVVQYLLLK